MLLGQRTQFFGQGEGQQEILGGHSFFELPFQPLLGLMMLAMRTIAMATGMWDEHLFFAAIALRQHHGALRGATLFQGDQRFALTGQHVLISRQKIG